MQTMKHKMGRMAFSKAVDVAYGRMGKDRSKAVTGHVPDGGKPYLADTEVEVNLKD